MLCSRFSTSHDGDEESEGSTHVNRSTQAPHLGYIPELEGATARHEERPQEGDTGGREGRPQGGTMDEYDDHHQGEAARTRPQYIPTGARGRVLFDELARGPFPNTARHWRPGATSRESRTTTPLASDTVVDVGDSEIDMVLVAPDGSVSIADQQIPTHEQDFV